MVWELREVPYSTHAHAPLLHGVKFAPVFRRQTFGQRDIARQQGGLFTPQLQIKSCPPTRGRVEQPSSAVLRHSLRYFRSPDKSTLVETKPMSATDVENMTARGATSGPAMRIKSRKPQAVTFLGTSYVSRCAR